MTRDGNGTVNLFNVGRFPVMEGSYAVYVSGALKTETTDYVFDLDNGDIRFTAAPANGATVRSEHKYAHWRDRNWLEAIAGSIEELNARGYFRPVVRSTSVFSISSNVQVYNGPSACVDVSEIIVSNTGGISGPFVKPYVNWRYDTDANKIVVGNKPTTSSRAAVSYLRRLGSPSATSVVLDVIPDWEDIIMKRAGAKYYRSLAGKIAKQGNATIDEGHFSFSNLRTMANDLDSEFEKLALRKKPARPTKDMQFFDPKGGPI